MTYDSARLANFGRDTARSYASFLRAQERMVEEINAAIEGGIGPRKVAHDLMGRCASREAQVNLLTVLGALVELERIPKAVFEPFEDGIRPRRI
jgi:hypothetical protein